MAFCVLGDADMLRAQGFPVRDIAEASQAVSCFADALPVLNRPLSAKVMPGQPDPRHAPHILDWIETGVAMCLSGEARGLVTVPIAKSVLYATGFGFPGHTEYLAELCKDAQGRVPQPFMMLTAKDLRVVLASIHIPLASVKDSLTTAHLVEIARITHAGVDPRFRHPCATSGHGRTQSACR